MEVWDWLALEERILTRRRVEQMVSKAKEAAALVKREYGVDVYLFGSLVEGRMHAGSDVDLLVCGPISEAQKREIIRKVEGIAMPFAVDVVFEDEVSVQFSRAVKDRGVKLTC